MEEEKKEEIETLGNTDVIEPVVEEPTVETPTEPVAETPAPAAEPVKEEKKEEPKKKSSPVLIILMVIAIIAGIGYAVWFFALGGNGSKAEPKEEPKPTEPENKIKEIDVSSSEVLKAMESFNYLDVSADELTKDDSYDISKLSFKQIVETLGNIAANKDGSLIAYCGNDITKEITIEKMNEYLKVALRTSLTKEELESNATDETIQTIDNKYEGKSIAGNGQFWIWIIDGKYYIHSNNCDGSSIDRIMSKKVTKAEKDNTHLYVYEKRGFYNVGEITETAEDGAGKVNVDYYKDYAKTELVETVQGTSVASINPYVQQEAEISWDKYITYKYTFNIKDGNYYFEKYELVK